MLSLGTSVTALGWGQRGASKCSEFASYTTNPYEEHFHHAETTQAGRLPETPYAHSANSPAGSTTAIEACADEQHLRECFGRLGGGGGLLECRDFRIGLCLLQGQYVSRQVRVRVSFGVAAKGALTAHVGCDDYAGVILCPTKCRCALHVIVCSIGIRSAAQDNQ